jgi:hypothetical protein
MNADTQKMSRRTPLIRGDESGSFAMSASALLTTLNTLVIVGLAAGVIATGVLVGNARNDVNTLITQTSNVTEFIPQVISLVDTPSRFTEVTPVVQMVVLNTNGFCVTLTNASTCTLMGNIYASYTAGTAPAAGTDFSFRVSNVFPAEFALSDATVFPPMQVSAVFVDSVSNTTIATFITFNFAPNGKDVFFQLFLPAGLADNTIDNSVICWTTHFTINYGRPK